MKRLKQTKSDEIKISIPGGKIVRKYLKKSNINIQIEKKMNYAIHFS